MTSYPYGKHAIGMLRELTRQNRLVDNPYDDENAQKVIDETNGLLDRINLTITRHPDGVMDAEVQTSLLFYHTTVLRNKRCMLAYLAERVRLIKDLRWELMAELIPQEVSSCLSPSEDTFRHKYNTLLRDYMRDMGIDITTNIDQPPTSVYVDVIPTENLGTIETIDGPLTLSRHTTSTMRRSEAEPLIKQGSLRHVTGM